MRPKGRNGNQLNFIQMAERLILSVLALLVFYALARVIAAAVSVSDYGTAGLLTAVGVAVAIVLVLINKNQ